MMYPFSDEGIDPDFAVAVAIALFIYMFGAIAREIYYNTRNRKCTVKDVVQMTRTQLALHNGEDPKETILTAVKGEIFDVSSNPKEFELGGEYYKFAGKEASIEDFDPASEESLKHWHGYLNGIYYLAGYIIEENKQEERDDLDKSSESKPEERECEEPMQGEPEEEQYKPNECKMEVEEHKLCDLQFNELKINKLKLHESKMGEDFNSNLVEELPKEEGCKTDF